MAFRLANKDDRAVLVKDGGLYDLEKHSGGKFSSNPMEAIARHKELHAVADGLGVEADAKLDENTRGICVPKPQKIFGIGLNIVPTPRSPRWRFRPTRSSLPSS